MHQHFIPFHCWVLHHGRAFWFDDLLTSGWAFFFFFGSKSGLSWIKLLWVFEYKSLYMHIIWFPLVNKHLGMAWFSHIDSLDFAYNIPLNCFPKSCTILPAMFGSSASIFLSMFGILETSLNCSQRQTIFFRLARWLSGEAKNDRSLVIKEALWFMNTIASHPRVSIGGETWQNWSIVRNIPKKQSGDRIFLVSVATKGKKRVSVVSFYYI